MTNKVDRADFIRNEIIANRHKQKNWINEKLKLFEGKQELTQKEQKAKGYLLDILEDLEYRDPTEIYK